MDESLILEDRLEELAGQGPVTTDVVRKFLSSLPSEETVEHQVNLAKLVGRVDGVTSHLERILDDDSAGTELRFAAFRALATYHRRNKNISRLEELHETYQHLFSDRPMYDAVYSVLLRVRGSRTDIRKAIDIQEAVLQDITDNPGLYQAHANTITQAIEDGILDGEQRADYLEKARKSIDQAITMWHEYGKYHVTKGRILALQGDYDEARRKIEKGIDLEDPDKDDYAIRIGTYQQSLLQTDFRQYEERLEGRLAEAEEKLSEIEERSETVVNRLRTTMLQFLGFFTAIIAAVITSIQISTNYAPIAAGHLVVIIFGGLVASYGGLSLTLPHDDGLRRNSVAVCVLGLVLVAVSMGSLYLG